VINIADESQTWRVRAEAVRQALTTSRDPRKLKRICSEFNGYLDRRVAAGTLTPTTRIKYIAQLIGALRKANAQHPALPDQQGWLTLPAQEVAERNERTHARTARMVEDGEGRIEVDVATVGRMVDWAEAVIARRASTYWELMSAVIILTGRRMVEIGFVASFEVDPEHPDTHLRIITTAKQRHGRVKNYSFPTLGNPELIVDAVDRMRSLPSAPTKAEEGDPIWSNRSRELLRVLRRAGFDLVRPNQLARSVYAAAAYRAFAAPDEHPRMFNARVLGHELPRSHPSDHYRKVELVG
jgi:hypothetical protein